MPIQYLNKSMSYREFISDAEYSDDSYNWSKLRKKYLDNEVPSPQNHQMEESREQKKYKKYRKGLSLEEIASLHMKKKNLQDFINSIGLVGSQPLRKEVVDHCQKIKMGVSGGVSCDSLMKLVKNRVEKMIKNKRIKKNWSEQDIKILIWVISKYADVNSIVSIENGLNENDWEYIANLIPGVTGKSCMFKWLSLKKNTLAENGWVEEESLLLDFVVKKYGTDNWCTVSEQLYELNNLPNKIYRCPKQCRQHWNCYLNPNLKKGPWSKTEDILLLKSVKDLNGLKKWAEIVKLFDGRTENALKNRFNLIIEKQLRELKHGKKKITELQLIQKYLDKVLVGPFANDKKIKNLKQSIKSKNVNNSSWKEYKTKKNDMLEEEELEYIPHKLKKKDRSASSRRQPSYNKIEPVEQKIPSLLSFEDSREFIQNIDRELSEANLSYCIPPKPEEQIYEEDQDIYECQIEEESISEKKQKTKKQIQNENNLTAEQCIDIDVSKIKMVEYSPELLQKLKLDLSNNKFNLIPVALNNNVIMSYPLQPNKQ